MSKGSWMGRWGVLLGAILVLTGCAHTISAPLRQLARKDLSFEQLKKDPDAYRGSIVILGGIIIEVNNIGPSKTRLEVLETPLGSREMPKDDVYSRGRFVAEVPKYLDPEVFRKGRKITVAGQVIGKETRTVGDVQLVCPLILVQEMHLWRKELRAYPSSLYWDWIWWGGRYGFYWGSYWPWYPYPWW